MERKIAELRGRFAARNGYTRLVERYHTAPLKIAKTFRIDGSGQLSVYMMDASPGILDGDDYRIELELENGTEVFITNQSFTKVHPTHVSYSTIRQAFTLGEGALLEYFPEPLIPYAKSRFTSGSVFHLAEGAELLFAEIITPGRTRRGELFQYESLTSELEVYRTGRLIAWDRLQIEPAIHRYYVLGALEKYTHIGAFWIISRRVDNHLLQLIRESVSNMTNLLLGASLTAEQGILVRMLGHNVWELQEAIRHIWDCCRVHLLQKQVYLPRK
jgi:urease accessory protein